MADLSIIIHAEPPVAFYQGARPAVDIAHPRLISVGDLVSDLRVDGGETPHVSATVDNGDGALSAWVADAPLTDEASIYIGVDELWRGVVSSIACGPVITIEIEA